MRFGRVGYHGGAVLRGGEGWDRIRLPGLVAQRQSGRLITDWSLVRIQAGPPLLDSIKNLYRSLDAAMASARSTPRRKQCAAQ